ncbi:MAG: hypothetical protein VKK97_04900 [Synechococcaceae cyanobacterium]|nr:hypothetical protein [Synechococcaceae cyanobacterium]
MSFTLPAGLSAETRALSGWSRTRAVDARVVQPGSVELLLQLGRSYGDSTQLAGGTVIGLTTFDRIDLDPASGCVTAGARKVTVGGAIATDVHGKNHHVDGSFGNHVRRLLLIDGNGQLHELSPDGGGNAEQAARFWATVGGMGLTGVIVEASFSLIPISSSLIRVDSLDPRGRGVLTCGDHAPAEALPSAPPFLPGGLLNKLTVRAFNEAWYRKAPRARQGDLQAIAPSSTPSTGCRTGTASTARWASCSTSSPCPIPQPGWCPEPWKSCGRWEPPAS